MPRTPRTATRRDPIAALREELHAERSTVELLQESVATLERQLADGGWLRLIAHATQEFTPEGLRRLREICRLYSLKNPLIKRAVNLRAAYVWGSGVQISARATGQAVEAGEQNVNMVIQSFLDGRGNMRALTGQQAQEELERTLGTDGEIAILLFTSPLTGRVRARTFSADEIADIRSNPDDATEPWYYHRRWTSTSYDAAGTPVSGIDECWYPHVDYRPLVRVPAIAGVRVRWDAPLLHVKINGLRGWQRGLPDVYAAIDWAKAYKEFLEDWARLMKSLSRYAWTVQSPAASKAATRAALAAAPTTERIAGEPLSAGATMRLDPNAKLEAISKSGATIDADSGRPLATMVASAVDLPVTMLLADPGQTGARATAETLDRPTELGMDLRRSLWTSVLRRICDHVITESVRAPRGALTGTIVREDDEEIVTLDGDTDQTIDITWPDLDETDPGSLVTAIVNASTTGTLPPELVLAQLLGALGVTDVDSIIAEMVDDNGDFQWPSTPGSSGTSGIAALAALAHGQDPAATGPGPMSAPTPTDPPVVDPPPGTEPAP